MKEISEEDKKKMINNQEMLIKMLDGLIKALENEKKKVIK